MNYMDDIGIPADSNLAKHQNQRADSLPTAPRLARSPECQRNQHTQTYVRSQRNLTQNLLVIITGFIGLLLRLATAFHENRNQAH